MDTIIPFNRYPGMRKFVYTIISAELCYKQVKRIIQVNEEYKNKLNKKKLLTQEEKLIYVESLIKDDLSEKLFFEMFRLGVLVFFLNTFSYFFITRRVLKDIKT